MSRDTLESKLGWENCCSLCSDLVWDLLWDGPTSFFDCTLVSRPLLDSCQEGLQVRIAIKAYPAFCQLHNIAEDDVGCAKILDKPVKKVTAFRLVCEQHKTMQCALTESQALQQMHLKLPP